MAQERAMRLRFPTAQVPYHLDGFTVLLDLPASDGIVMADVLQ